MIWDIYQSWQMIIVSTLSAMQGGKKSPYKAALKWIRLHISTPIKLESASQCLCLDIFVCVVVLISLSQHIVCIGKPHPSGLGEDRVVR